MLNSFGRILAAAGLMAGIGLAAVPASAAPAGISPAAPSSGLNVELAQYYPPPPGYRRPPGYRPPPPGYRYGYRAGPRRVCRWETVRVRGPYGWRTQRVQRCYRR